MKIIIFFIKYFCLQFFQRPKKLIITYVPFTIHKTYTKSELTSHRATVSLKNKGNRENSKRVTWERERRERVGKEREREREREVERVKEKTERDRIRVIES